VNASESLRLANRVIERLLNHQIPHIGNPVLGQVTVSAGVATARIEGELSLETLITNADAALYKAKQQGRNRACQH
jgi:diguanylate cyclase (GGDEF)-like protein